MNESKYFHIELKKLNFFEFLLVLKKKRIKLFAIIR